MPEFYDRKPKQSHSEAPSDLELVFRSCRHAVTDTFLTTTSRPLAALYSLQTSVSALHDQNEKFVPAALYVVLAAFSASIIAQGRSRAARAAFPIVAVTAATSFLFPKTTLNAGNALYKIASEYCKLQLYKMAS